MQPVTQLSNVIDLSVINSLIDYYSKKPIANTRYRENGDVYRNIKHSDYNIEDGEVYKLLNPIIEKIVGPHKFEGGHYLDAHWPFEAHFDSNVSFRQRHVATGFEDKQGLGIGCLIPLTEGPYLQTVFFDYFDAGLETLADIPAHELTGDCTSQIDLLDHHNAATLEILSKMNIVSVCTWKLRDMILFDRQQLHASTNFSKYVPSKQCIVLWI